MAKKTLETSDAPQVVVENVGSDLQVKGWDRNEILVKSSSDNDIVLEEREDGVFVACRLDARLIGRVRAGHGIEADAGQAGPIPPRTILP